MNIAYMDGMVVLHEVHTTLTELRSATLELAKQTGEMDVLKS